MDAVIAKLADGAPFIVLLILVCAWAVYRWPMLLLWNALQESIARRDALHERTLDALNNNTAAMNALVSKVKANSREDG